MTNNDPLISLNRRQFLQATGSAFAALLASGCQLRSAVFFNSTFTGYGDLQPDPAGILDLPKDFDYRILSRLGDAMSDGGSVPDKADGMGCFAIDKNEIVLIRNHELVPEDMSNGRITEGFGTRYGEFVPGGTTHVVLDADSLAVKNQFRSLGGTIRNCSGGITPWNSLAHLRGNSDWAWSAFWRRSIPQPRLGIRYSGRSQRSG